MTFKRSRISTSIPILSSLNKKRRRFIKLKPTVSGHELNKGIARAKFLKPGVLNSLERQLDFPNYLSKVNRILNTDIRVHDPSPVYPHEYSRGGDKRSVFLKRGRGNTYRVGNSRSALQFLGTSFQVLKDLNDILDISFQRDREPSFYEGPDLKYLFSKASTLWTLLKPDIPDSGVTGGTNKRVRKIFKRFFFLKRNSVKGTKYLSTPESASPRPEFRRGEDLPYWDNLITC